LVSFKDNYDTREKREELRKDLRTLSYKTEFLARALAPDVFVSNTWTVPELVTECEFLMAKISKAFRVAP